MKTDLIKYTGDQILQTLRHRPRGLTKIQICNLLKLPEEQIQTALQQLEEQETIYTAVRGRSTIYLIHPQAALARTTPPSAEQAAAPPEPPPSADNFVVAAYSDGRLLIEQDGQSLMLTAPQTKQLLAFTANWRQS